MPVMNGEQTKIYLSIEDCTSDVGLLNELELGVEVQHLAVPEVMDGNWKDKLAEYQDKFCELRGGVSLHAAAFDLNPAGSDVKIREVTRERYLRSLEIAKLIRATHVVFHSQINPGIKNPEFKQAKVERQLPFWQEMLAETEQQGTVLLLENLFETDPADLLTLVESIDSPRVKVCLDLGHVQANTLLTIGDWIDGLSPHIAYIHLHDNDGKVDQHLPPTEKLLVELRNALARHKLNPIISLEYRVEDPRAEIGRLRRHL